MFLAWKELVHSKFRYMMMSMIIILIAWLVFILAGLGNGLSTLSAATIKNIDANYVAYEDTAGATFSKSLLSEDIQGDLEKQSDIEKLAAFGSSTASVAKTETKDANDKVDTAFIGLEEDAYIFPEVIEGEKIQKANEFGVVVNDTLKDEGYKLGDQLIVSNSTMKLKIIGFVNNETFNHLPVVFMNLDTWRAFHYAAPGSDNEVSNPIQAFFIKGENVNAEKVEKTVDNIHLATKSEAINGMPGYVAENGTIMMMLAFLVVISAFIIAVFFYVITMQKTQQFGVMKAIGASNGFIARSIVAQVFILSVIGIGLGVVLTYLTALALPQGMPFNLDTTMVIIYAIVLLIIALLSSIISVRQIVKIDPLTALGRVE